MKPINFETSLRGPRHWLQTKELDREDWLSRARIRDS